MNSHTLVVTLLLAASAGSSPAQTAAQWVTQGRVSLAAHDLASAQAKFTSAVTADPANETANTLLGTTRLLALYQHPQAQTLMDELSVGGNGRDIYGWTAKSTRDAQGIPIPTANANLNDQKIFLRVTVLPEITLALENLAKVKSSNFTLTLASNETAIADTTIDYGDILLIRAGVHGLQYFLSTLAAHDLQLGLVTLRSLYDGEYLDMERLLASHPQLLRYTHPAEAAVARAAFANAVDCYQAASAFLRARPLGTPCLFELAAEQRQSEEKFRTTLGDLKASLQQAVTLQVADDYTFFMDAHFTGTHALRDLLPAFNKYRVVDGSLPDPTMGGVLPNRSLGATEKDLRDVLQYPSAPSLRSLTGASTGRMQFTLHGNPCHGYVLQSSTDLRTWQTEAGLTPVEGNVVCTPAPRGPEKNRFYRVIDDSSSMPAPANDLLANRLTLTGAQPVAYGYTWEAGVEASEYPSSGGSVWYDWKAPTSGTYGALVDGCQGSFLVRVGTGTTMANLAMQGNFFGAQAGTTYMIQVYTPSWNQRGAFKLVLSQRPNVAIAQPSPNSIFYGPTNIALAVNASDNDGTIRSVKLSVDHYVNSQWLTDTYEIKHPPYQLTLSNAEPSSSSYHVYADATDNQGLHSFASISFQILPRPLIVQPANDFFASRITITGSSATLVVPSTLLATKETGEPNHAAAAGGHSVWWTWTAPKTGTVVITTDGSLDTTGNVLDTTMGVYTGNSLGTLFVVTSNDDGEGVAPNSLLTFTATQGDTYQIAVDGFGDATSFTGSIRLNLSQP